MDVCSTACVYVCVRVWPRSQGATTLPLYLQTQSFDLIQDVHEEDTELDLTSMDAKSVAEAPLVVQLARRLDEAQQLVGRHLSVSGFVGTIETLMSRKDGYVQQRALQCLIHKLQLLDSGLSLEMQALILSLMPLLGTLASTGIGKGSAKEVKRNALVVQLSLCSIEHLARLFGSHTRNQAALDEVVGSVVAALQHESASVTTSACSCAAAMVWHSSTMMINHVNDIVPGLIAVLERALGPASNLSSPRRTKARAVELDDESLLQAQVCVCVRACTCMYARVCAHVCARVGASVHARAHARAVPLCVC